MESPGNLERPKQEPRRRGHNTGLHYSFLEGRVVLGEAATLLFKTPDLPPLPCPVSVYGHVQHSLTAVLLFIQVQTGRVS